MEARQGLVTQEMISAGEGAYYAADRENVPYLVQLIYEAMQAAAPRVNYEAFLQSLLQNHVGPRLAPEVFDDVRKRIGYDKS